ncbi:MAG: hypothetical protein ACFB0A_17350 [Croceivirga sp.]
MKTIKLFLKVSMLTICFLSSSISCSKDETNSDEPSVMDTDGDGIIDANDDCPTQMGLSSNQGCPESTGQIVETDGQVTEDDFEKFDGELGMVINARNIAKKGYNPANANIKIEAALGDYSQTITIEPITFIGQLRIPIKGLENDVVEELEEGVAVSIEIKDANGNRIISENFSAVIFRSNPQPVLLNVTNLEETEAFNTIALKEDTPYYMQSVDAEGQPLEMALRVNRLAGFNNIMTRTSNPSFLGFEVEPDFIFNFVPFPGEQNTFAIRMQEDGKFFLLRPLTFKGNW